MKLHQSSWVCITKWTQGQKTSNAVRGNCGNETRFVPLQQQRLCWNKGGSKYSHHITQTRKNLVFSAWIAITITITITITMTITFTMAIINYYGHYHHRHHIKSNVCVQPILSVWQMQPPWWFDVSSSSSSSSSPSLSLSSSPTPLSLSSSAPKRINSNACVPPI